MSGYEVLKTFPSATKYLKTIVSFGKVTPEQKEEVEKFGLAIYAWDEFLLLGDDKQYDPPVKKKSDICTIMYTSGTTGNPKGVLISNNSIVTLIAGVRCLLGSVHELLTEKDVYLSYLPLAHFFDRVIEECFINIGGPIGFCRGDVKLLTEDIGELKPTIFCAVPRVLDRIYAEFATEDLIWGSLKKYYVQLCILILHNMKKGSKHVDAAPLCDKIVFNKVKHGLGGNVRLILSGAAPLATHVEAFLRVVACCHVLQGYGLTESCAGTFVSLPNELGMLGTVGPPVPNVDVCLESIPEMGYDALSSTPRGEICIRGDTLFSGYYKREDLTKEVLIDGWLHTGDVGEWQPNGSLKIIDRKKNIFKLSQGEYVAVENLENVYGSVTEIWVYGNSFESFLVAVVNPNKQVFERWAEENGVPGDFNSLCENPKAKQNVLVELTRIGKEKKLKGFEFIKAVHLDPEPFDMERDLLTPTFKKRPQLLKYYQNIVDNMYKGAKFFLANSMDGVGDELATIDAVDNTLFQSKDGDERECHGGSSPSFTTILEGKNPERGCVFERLSASIYCVDDAGVMAEELTLQNFKNENIAIVSTSSNRDAIISNAWKDVGYTVFPELLGPKPPDDVHNDNVEHVLNNESKVVVSNPLAPPGEYPEKSCLARLTAVLLQVVAIKSGYIPWIMCPHETAENSIDQDSFLSENDRNEKRPLEQAMHPAVSEQIKKQKFGENLNFIRQWHQFPSRSSFKTATAHDTDVSIAGPKDSWNELNKEHNLRREYKSESNYSRLTPQLRSTYASDPLEEKKWYTSPEELSGKGCTFSSNIYILGVLLFELLSPFHFERELAAAMSDLHYRILPPNFLSKNPKEVGFCLWLLHLEPSLRPTASSDVISGVEESFEDKLSSLIDQDDAESELLLHFFFPLEEQKQKDTLKLVEEIKYLEADIEEVQRRQTKKSLVLACSSKESLHPRGNGFCHREHSSFEVHYPVANNELKLMKNISQLESVYFSTRSNIQISNNDVTTRANKELLKDRANRYRPQKDEEKNKPIDFLGAFFSGFCKDYFATAGVSKKIKIYEFDALFNDGVDIHYPAIEMSNKSRLSCICWNSYIRNYLALTDYDGIVKVVPSIAIAFVTYELVKDILGVEMRISD
ncbi:unnamed protein product [Camellia sinensis]